MQHYFTATRIADSRRANSITNRLWDLTLHRHRTEVTEEHNERGRRKCLCLSSQSWIVAAILVPSHDQFRPSLVEEDPHVVAGLAHRAVVFVEDLAVVEHQVHVFAELLSQLVHPVIELLSYRGDVHRGLDDLLVCRELLGVDRGEERPGFVVTTKL